MGGEVPEDGPGGVVAEGHVVKADVPPQTLHGQGPGWVRRLGLLVQQVQHPLGGGGAGLELGQEVGSLPDGAGELPGVEHEGGETPQGQPAPQVQQGPEDADGGEGDVVGEVHRGPQGGAGPVRVVVDPGGRVVAPVEEFQVRLLHAVGPNGLPAAHALLGEAVESSQLLGPEAEEGVDALHLKAGQGRRQRDGDEKHQGQPGGEEQKHQEGPGHGEDAGAKLEQVRGEGGVDGVHVVADAADEVPRRVGVEVVHGQLAHVVKGGLAQVVRHGLGRPDEPGGHEVI